MKPEARLSQARYEAEQAKKRLASTVGALQYRLKPATLANQAWTGMREKGEEVADGTFHTVNDFADGAVRAVKDRPVAASGVAAAALIFLARAPLWRAASRVFRGREDEGIVKADLAEHDENFDLTAPTVTKTLNEGVSA